MSHRLHLILGILPDHHPVYQDEILKNEDIILNEIMNTSLFQKEKVFLINNSNDKLLNFLNSFAK